MGRTRRFERGCAVLVAIGALGLAGCSTNEEPESSAPTVATADPAPTAEPTPAEEPTPTEVPDGVVDLTNEADGIVFVSLPELTGDEAAVMNTYMAYEVEQWAARRSASVADSMYAVASIAEVEKLKLAMQQFMDAGAHLDGTVSFAPDIELIDGDYAVVTACGDESAAVAVFPDQTLPVVETGTSGIPTFRAAVDLTREAGSWKVTSYAVSGEVCTL